MRFYSDAARTNCVTQFRRWQVVTPITVQTMSLESFKKMLANCDDVEFFYHKIHYNFMREDDDIILQDGKSIAEVQAEIEL